MKSKNFNRYIFIITVLFALSDVAAHQGRAQSAGNSPGALGGSLQSIAAKKRALLIVSRATILDVNNGERSIIEQALRADPRLNRRHRLAYGTLAQKLNEYIRKYHSMSAVERLEDADYIIFFNLLEYRWPLGTPYPYGELFVIAKGEGSNPEGSATIVWKSPKVEWVGDSVKTLIKQMKIVKGEG